VGVYIRVCGILFDSSSIPPIKLYFLWLTNRALSSSSNKMPAAVRRALSYAAKIEGKMSDTDAKAYIEKMEREGRLFEECWS
jgi:hypothetical protein